MTYNTERFRLKDYDFFTFSGPRAGEPALDFSLTDLEGSEVGVADFRGKWIVLETASVTCSMYSRNISNMNEIAKEYPDVEFLVVYVREAHPGERLSQHKSFDDKMAAAKLLKPRLNEDRRVLVDGFEGEMHQAYGSFPNVVYLINPEGIVTYRCDWTYLNGLRNALANRDQFVREEHAGMENFKDRSIKHSLSTMMNGGWLAIWDFFKALPFMVREHKRADEFYQKHGQLKR